MSKKTEFFNTLARETMAMIVVNEYLVGNQTLPQLKELLNTFATNDLDRVGLMELIIHKAKNMGLSPGQIVCLHSGLSPDANLTEHSLETQNLSTPLPQDLASTAPQAIRPKTRLDEVRVPPKPAIQTPASLKATVEAGQFAVKRPVPIAKRHEPIINEDSQKISNLGSDLGGLANRVQKMAEKRVLIADDDQRIRMIFRKKLEDAGYLVDEASDGEDAWGMLHANRYGAFVMDMKMPGLHGLELLARLTSEGSKIPVCVCSAFDQLKDDFVVATYPKLKYFVKPVPPNDLVAGVKEFLPI